MAEELEVVTDAPVVTRRSRMERGSTRNVNLRDVAAEANVSVATVSMVLNNNPRISRSTHARVQRVMDRLGYQPNRLAQSLSSKYTNVLAVLLPALRHAFSDAYFGELISGISDRARQMGYKLMLEQASEDFVEAKRHIELYDRRFVDGVLCLGLDDTHEFLADFAPEAYPALVVNNVPNVPGLKGPLDHVICDYASGARQMMNYLLQLGHRRIGLITAAPEVSTARTVRAVYEERLESVGVGAKQTWVEDGYFTEEGGASAARTLVERCPEITALFCGNDKMAIGALHQLSRLGIKVPDQISVVGFDDLPNAAFVTPGLTTVHLPLYQVGRLAVERLIDRIRGREKPVADVVGTHLVVRESTAMAS